MTEIIDCPICLSEIDPTRNVLTTECGHTFHTSCIMKNVQRNGFDCPCCRASFLKQYDDMSQIIMLGGLPYAFSTQVEEEEEETKDDNENDNESTFLDDESTMVPSEESTVIQEPFPPTQYIMQQLQLQNVNFCTMVEMYLREFYPHEYEQSPEEDALIDDKFDDIINSYNSDKKDVAEPKRFVFENDEYIM